MSQFDDMRIVEVQNLYAIYAVFHELTHIWQYVNWDNKKGFNVCPKNRRLLIYEGMAKWAEIQYLYLVGETAVARREEFITRNREDEYGIGFKMIERELFKIPSDKVRDIAKQNIEDIKNSNRRDFRF